MTLGSPLGAEMIQSKELLGADFNAQMFTLLGYDNETQSAPRQFGSSLVGIFESFLNFSGHVQIGETLRQTPNTARMAGKS